MDTVQRMNYPSGNSKRAEVEAGCLTDRIARIPQQVQSVIDEQPLVTVSAAFTVGLIAGAGAVALYCQSQPSHQSTLEQLTHRLTEALKNLPRDISSFGR